MMIVVHAVITQRTAIYSIVVIDIVMIIIIIVIVIIVLNLYAAMIFLWLLNCHSWLFVVVGVLQMVGVCVDWLR